jgi:hypothetical protein
MQKTARTAHRQLRLVDLENLAGQPVVSLDSATVVAQRLETVLPRGRGDLQAVATAHISGFAAKTAFPEATVRWRSGKDGADLALLEYAGELPLCRFHELVVASADAIFAGLINDARVAGLAVTIVADTTRASRRVLALADRVIEFQAVSA